MVRLKKFQSIKKKRFLYQSPYAARKISSDQLALSYFSSFNLPVCVIRPFNTFGPRQSKSYNSNDHYSNVK